MAEEQITDVELVRGLARMATAFGKPAPDRATLEVWLERMQANDVTALEFAAACEYLIDQGGFFPVVGVAVQRALRIRSDRLHEAREAERRDHLASIRREHTQAIEAPRAPRPGDRRFGPVLRPDGSSDPDWPEILGREPAWRRKMLFDLGIWSFAEATARSLKAARAAGKALGLEDGPRGGGPRRLI